MDVDFDFSDVDRFFKDGESEIVSGMQEEGEVFTDDAKSTGNYTDHTKMLREANVYETDKSGLMLKNEAEYASFVESKGFEVTGSAALRTEKRLKDRFE